VLVAKKAQTLPEEFAMWFRQRYRPNQCDGTLRLSPGFSSEELGMINIDQDIDQIVKYLFRAEATRLRAEGMREHGLRASLLRVAAQYDEMALTMERVAKGALHRP
jgi:hypothetical protein